jgi:hypothetical protein
MPSHAVKQVKKTPIEFADRTLELDMSSFLGDRAGAKSDSHATTGSSGRNNDDATVVLDLTTTQIHKLISEDRE